MSAKGNYYDSPSKDTVSHSKKIADDGVDVAKQKLDVSVDDNTALTHDNDEESFKNLLKLIPDRGSVCFVRSYGRLRKKTGWFSTSSENRRCHRQS